MRLLVICLILSNSFVFGQIGMGQWRLHIPANRAIDVVAAGDRVFTAYQNGVSEFEFSSSEISIWDAVNSLSDISVACLGYSNANNAVFIGYENGNIDKIKDNKVTNIPAIKLAEIQGSKRINRIVEYGAHVYLATGFAVVKIDPVKNEVRDTYYPTNGNKPILDVAFRNDSIYALTSDEMYRGAVNNIALADPTQWVVDSRVPVLTSNAYQDIEVVDDSLYLLFKVDGYGLDTVYTVLDSGLNPPVIEAFNAEIASIKNINENLAVNYYDGAIVYNNIFGWQDFIQSYAFGGSARPNNLAYSDNKYWIADNDVGLVEYSSPGNNQKRSIVGLPKGETYAMDWQNGKLAVTGGGINSTSPTINRAGLYVFENEDWILKDENNMTMWNGQNVWDFISVSFDPTDSDKMAASTYSNIPVSIISISGQVTDTLTPNNSLIAPTSLGNGMSLVSEVKYDDAGNLWMLNGYSNEPLKVYTNDGNTYAFDCGVSAKSKFTQNMVIDYNGNKWFSVLGVGLYGYNDNGSISSASDDEYVLLNSGTNTGALPSNQVNAIAVDFDNEIWIGTDNGFAVLYNSDGAFGAAAGDYNAQRIKLEYEGNVEYVLGATDITDIEVDGANRKWFGTSNSGIVLLSADGLEIIEQHTVENSPLISNNIIDLKLDHSTGELYIITDQGMVSYRTDATYEDPDYENVVVFPNPARPEFMGPVTIQGIRYNSDVKITDVAGNLVYQTTSNGGTATWDCKTLQGERVATGVYLIWTAANEGKGRKVGKVVVVN